MNDPKFSQRIQDAGKLPIQESKAATKEINLEVPLNAWGNDIEQIRKKYKLSKIYGGVIKTYCLFGNVAQIGGTSIKLKYKGVNTLDSEMYLQIHPHTTLDDVKTIWPLVKVNKKNLWNIDMDERSKSMDFGDLSKRILELDLKYPKNNWKIADILSNEKRGAFTADQVAKIKSRAKKIARK